MGTVFYGVGGEGRGHATRVRAVVEELHHQHAVTIYAPAHAYELLAPAYRFTDVRVRRIPGILSHYDMQKKLNYPKTVWYGVTFAFHLPRLVRLLQSHMEKDRPDLVITDFEPALPRAAERCGIPYISLNHQHFLATYDLSSLPVPLQRRAGIMGRVIPSYHSHQAETIVSSFFFPRLKKEYQEDSNVTQVGVLLRPEILNIPTQNSGHLVAYLRRFAPTSVLEALARTGKEVRVYGLGLRPPFGTLRFFEVDIFRFVDDLASSEALICTAGNQLVGESLFLGKPVLAMPEPNNHEQYMNAHFLRESGAGLSVEMEELSSELILEFLDRREEFRSRIDRERLNGNTRALEIISRYLPAPRSLPDWAGTWRSIESVA